VLAGAAGAGQFVFGQVVDDFNTGQVGRQRLALATTLDRRNDLFRFGLCSNLAAPYAIPAKLLLPSFDVYGWSFEVGAIKPEPAIYRQMIEQLGCEASAIAMIGDTLQADMLGPIGQGMRGYHLQREGKADQCGFVSLMDFAAHVLQYPPSVNG